MRPRQLTALICLAAAASLGVSSCSGGSAEQVTAPEPAASSSSHEPSSSSPVATVEPSASAEPTPAVTPTETDAPATPSTPTPMPKFKPKVERSDSPKVSPKKTLNENLMSAGFKIHSIDKAGSKTVLSVMVKEGSRCIMPLTAADSTGTTVVSANDAENGKAMTVDELKKDYATVCRNGDKSIITAEKRILEQDALQLGYGYHSSVLVLAHRDSVCSMGVQVDDKNGGLTIRSTQKGKDKYAFTPRELAENVATFSTLCSGTEDQVNKYFG